MIGVLLSIALACATSSVSWQQAGGSFQATPTLKGIVNQGYETPVVTSTTGEVRSGFLVHPLFLNQGPFVSSPLADQVLHIGATATTLDLSNVFTSWEGNGLTCSVSGGDATVLAQVSGSTLSLSGQRSGSVRLVVTATDGSLEVHDTFEVTVEGTTSIARPATVLRSGLLEASIVHPMARVAQGRAAASLDVGGNRDDENRLSLELSIPSESSVSVSIFDNLGTPVISWFRDFTTFDLARIRPQPDGRHAVTLSWNLRASDGTPVAPGVYLWKIVATTKDGQKLETVKRMGVK